MTALLAFLRVNWKPVALLIAAGLTWWLLHHYGERRYSDGYQKAISENEQALALWKAKYEAQVKADEDRLRRANEQHTKEIADLAAIRAQPVPRVVCHTASRSSDVPAAAKLPAGEARDSGNVSRAPAPDPQSFDPTDELIALADRADAILADCRALHAAVHGFPSAP